MKLSYREKIGLLIVIVLTVIIVFIAVPIKNIKSNIKIHTDEKIAVQEEYDETQRLIAQIPGIESNINKIVEESKGLTKNFTEHRENVDVDKYLQSILNKAENVKSGKNQIEIIDKLEIANADKGEIPFYYYTPDVITYPILEKADTNGNLLETTNKKLYEKAVNAVKIADLENQEVEIRYVTVPMKFTKEALLALEEDLKSETGIRITGVKIEDYTFTYVAEVPEDKGFSTGEVTFAFYTMQQIQDPDFSK